MLWMMLTSVSQGAAPREGSAFPPEVPARYHTDARVKKRVEAVYPDVPPEVAREDHRCIVWVLVGEDGRPTEVKILPAFSASVGM